jgi:hypothetical protein
MPYLSPKYLLMSYCNLTLVFSMFLSPLCSLIMMDGVEYLPILLLVPINGPLTPSPPLVHIVATNASFPSPSVHPTLPVHIVATNTSMPPPPPPKDHKTTPHGSQVDKGKQPITSTSMAKSSSSAHSKIKSTSSGKRSLSDLHLEVANWKRKEVSV